MRPPARTNSESLQFFRTVLQRVEALPGVGAASVSMRARRSPDSTPLVHVNARATGAGHRPSVTNGELPGRQPTLLRRRQHRSIASGRPFNDRDDASRPAVAIVNETLAARLWPGGDAIGRRLWLEAAASPVPCMVVGVAKDSKYLTLGEDRQGHVYLPFAQRPRRGMALLVRSGVAADRMTSAVQDVLRALTPRCRAFSAGLLPNMLPVSTLPVRYAAGLTAALAILALALALAALARVVPGR